ncbi:MAG: DUF262 domain-containing protein [Ruminococcaceae bacterium]|nr:DUF262 domain-containing protein [Oscillospiraceae bacterium]
MGMPTGLNPTINEIVKCITDGEYRIPRFQRDFVWDIKKSAALLDSIFKGFPISSVILWKTKKELSEIRNLGGIEIPGRDTGRYTSYIIDGQQRLTSLYFALKGLQTSSGSDFSEMCISLVAQPGEQLVFDSIPKGSTPDDYVTIKSLFDATALNGPHADKRLKYYQTLLQYTISVIEIDDENLELDEVIEIFERLNLGGKKLNLFSIIAARSYIAPENGKKGFDLAKQFDSFNKILIKNNYGKISDSTFLQAIAACLIEKVNKSDILNNLNSELIENNYISIEKAILAAIEHLKNTNYGVLVANLLPYERILVAFTYFHYKMGNNHIGQQQERYLVDFFWRCVLSKRYNNAATTNLNADIVKIKKIVNNETPNQEPIILSPKTIYENGRFVMSSAYVIGMLCLMAQAPPQSFAVGRTINITNDSVSNSSKKQFHHFFPMKSLVVLANPEYQSIVNNVVNIVFMDAITNDQISNRNPSDYITEFAQSNPNFTEALESHYISLHGYGIKDNDFFSFINARSRSLYNKLCQLIIPSKADTITDISAIV